MRIFHRRARQQPEAMSKRVARRRRAERLGGVLVEDMVFGANDGIITTFAVVAGVTGGALGAVVIVILGFANLFADALSMGASNFLGRRSKRDYIRSQREMEEWEIDHVPDQEREELRRIFQNFGLRGEQLENVVAAVAQNKSAWVDAMMTGELGLTQNNSSPFKHGVATAGAFVVAGSVPILPYLFCPSHYCFVTSAVFAGVALFIAGALRTLITQVNWLRSGIEMLAVGSVTAAVAYAVARAVSSLAQA